MRKKLYVPDQARVWKNMRGDDNGVAWEVAASDIAAAQSVATSYGFLPLYRTLAELHARHGDCQYMVIEFDEEEGVTQ